MQLGSFVLRLSQAQPKVYTLTFQLPFSHTRKKVYCLFLHISNRLRYLAP
jgi:hypothetical protein